MKLRKTWQEKLTEEAEEESTRAQQRTVENTVKGITQIQKTLKLKKRLINKLREKPANIFGNIYIYIRTKNYKLAHDVAKELGIKLERTAGGDGFNYNGKYEGISICVYGMQTVPNCKIVSHKEMREITIYETVCNEK